MAVLAPIPKRQRQYGDGAEHRGFLQVAQGEKRTSDISPDPANAAPTTAAGVRRRRVHRNRECSVVPKCRHGIDRRRPAGRITAARVDVVIRSRMAAATSSGV